MGICTGICNMVSGVGARRANPNSKVLVVERKYDLRYLPYGLQYVYVPTALFASALLTLARSMLKWSKAKSKHLLKHSLRLRVLR